MTDSEPGYGHRFVRSDEVLWRRASGAVVLLALHGAEPFELAGTGLALWDVLARPTTIDEASAVLATGFGASVDQVAGDIRPILAELVRRRVVIEVGAG